MTRHRWGWRRWGWHRHRRRPRAKGDIVPLADLDAGESAVVIDLHGGNWVLGRMTALGFTPGADVRVVQNRGHGPLLAQVRDTRVALGRHQAEMVIVRRAAQ